ncbi:HpaA family protein [Helicobacter cetorum]|uniref:HpaA family protein n=1 Tax=Helicobacter cetorum TaxID=138563 RepID=UPI000CF042E6|nr:HpaA family protein [Helicobacter cetorum]
MLFKIKMGLLLGVVMTQFYGCLSHQGMFAPPNLDLNYTLQTKKSLAHNPSIALAPIEFSFKDSKISPYYSKKYALALKKGIQEILKNQGYEVLKKPHRTLKTLFAKLNVPKESPFLKLKIQAHLKLDFKQVGFMQEENANKSFILLAKGSILLDFNHNQEKLGTLAVPIETKAFMPKLDDSIETYAYVRGKEDADNNANIKQALSQIYHFIMQSLEERLDQQTLITLTKPSSNKEKIKHL